MGILKRMVSTGARSEELNPDFAQLAQLLWSRIDPAVVLKALRFYQMLRFDLARF